MELFGKFRLKVELVMHMRIGELCNCQLSDLPFVVSGNDVTGTVAVVGACGRYP